MAKQLPMVKMRVVLVTRGVRAMVMRRPLCAWLHDGFSFWLILAVYLTIPRMLAFEEEFTRLMTALWLLNKNIAHPSARRDIGTAVTHSVPKFDFPRSADAPRAAAEL